MDNREKILFEIFIDESMEQLDKIESKLEKLEKRYNEHFVQDIFRAFHSIKGSALSMNYDDLSGFIHNVESLLAKVKNKEIEFDDIVLDLLYESSYKAREFIQNIIRGSNKKVDTNKVCTLIEELIGVETSRKTTSRGLTSVSITDHELFLIDEALKNKENVFFIKVEIEKDAMLKNMKAFLVVNNIGKFGNVLKVWPEDYDTISDEQFNEFKTIFITSENEECIIKNIEAATEIKDIVIEKLKNANDKSLSKLNIKVREKQGEEINFRKEKRKFIRVNINEFNELLNKSVELNIDGEKIRQLSQNLSNIYKDDINVSKLSYAAADLNNISMSIQDSIIDIRLYTIKNIFERLEKLVIDLAKRSGKQINFITIGKNIKIDRAILEEIVDPLVHIMRNSVDHGLETAEERVRKGKKPYGTIRLKVEQRNNFVIFEVWDDGKGFDIENIKQKAVENNNLSVNQLKKMKRQELLDLAFLPGLSTAQDITDISGRGVGMDVVKTNIESINGTINIKTTKDKGSKITIKIPLEFSIIESIIADEGEYEFAIPNINISEQLVIDDKIIESIKANMTYNYNGEEIPAILINDLYNLSSDIPYKKLLIINSLGKKVAFAVKEVLPKRQLLIKSLGDFVGEDKLLGVITGLSGVTTLKDGKIAYFLDIDEIIEAVKKA